MSCNSDDFSYSEECKSRKNNYSSNKEEDNGGVVIRLAQNSIEKSRMEKVSTHLGGLSSLVNAYEVTEFKSELKCKIKGSKHDQFRKAVFLDNGRIAVLVQKDYSFHMNTYNPYDGELISSKEIISLIPVVKITKYSNFDVVITPMRNILITFYTNKSIRYIYYCNQDIEKIWYVEKESPDHEKIGSLYILNNDTVIIQESNYITLKSKDQELKWDWSYFLTSVTDFDFDLLNLKFIPYGNRGFIVFWKHFISFYDDNYKEYSIANKNTLEITCAKLIGEETLLCATSGKTLILFDLIKRVEIKKIVLTNWSLIVRIEILPNNRCLLLYAGSRWRIINAEIHNLNDSFGDPVIMYYPKYFIKYKNTFSNGDVPFFSFLLGKKSLQICDMNTLQRKDYNLEKVDEYSKLLDISSTDLVLILNKKELNNELLVFG
jgi:hypothetical protein